MKETIKKNARRSLETIVSGIAALSIAGTPVDTNANDFGQYGTSNSSNKPELNLYVDLLPQDESLYSKESVELAKDYLEENVGVDVNVKYCDNIPKSQLNYQNSWRVEEEKVKEAMKEDISELNRKKQKLDQLSERIGESRESANERMKMAEQSLENYRDNIEDISNSSENEDSDSGIGEYASAMKKAAKSSLEGTEDALNDFQETTDETYDSMERKVEMGKVMTDAQKLATFEKYKNASAEAEVPEHKACLYNDMVRALHQQAIDTYGEMISDDKDFLTKMRAMTLVHEIGHLGGLWHTFKYDNDPNEDETITGKTNVMSYDAPDNTGKFGFDMTDEQKERFRNYIKGGEPFKRMEEAGGNFSSYCEDVANEKGYE